MVQERIQKHKEACSSDRCQSCALDASFPTLWDDQMRGGFLEEQWPNMTSAAELFRHLGWAVRDAKTPTFSSSTAATGAAVRKNEWAAKLLARHATRKRTLETTGLRPRASLESNSE